MICNSIHAIALTLLAKLRLKTGHYAMLPQPSDRPFLLNRSLKSRVLFSNRE